MDSKAPDSDRNHSDSYHIPTSEGASTASVWVEHCGAPTGEYKMKVAFHMMTNKPSMVDLNNNA